MDADLWLGSLSLYQSYMSRTEAATAAFLAGTLQDVSGDSSPDPRYFSLFGNVAVLDITGSLTNDDSFWTSWNGDTSYNQIRRGLIEAAMHEDVQSIVLNIDSGGGTPNGLKDVGDMVKQISSMGKTIESYSGGVMASAAYWLGSCADKTHAGATADVGSIGVISIHKDYTGMMKQDGVKATVMRAGSEKALSNPYEPLSDKAKEGIQSRLDTLYQVFIDEIAANRHVPAGFVREHMADGKEFIGQQALDAGLVDSITTLDDLITGLQSRIDKQASKETPMAKQKTVALTKAQQDLLLEGVAPAVVLETVPEVEADATAEVAAELPAEDPQLNVEIEVKPELNAPTGDSEIVKFLREELATRNNEAVSLQAKVAGLEARVAAFEATHEPMKKLVASSVSRMAIGLGAPQMDYSALSAEVLLEHHKNTLATFCTKFPVGGVASIPVEDADSPTHTPVAASPVDQARRRQATI